MSKTQETNMQKEILSGCFHRHFVQALAARIKVALVGEEGATAIEYGLIAAGVAVTISGAVFLFSDQVVTLFDTTAQAVDRIP